jgi:hypothetical protein
MDTRILIFFCSPNITHSNYEKKVFSIFRNYFNFNFIPCFISCFLIITINQTFSQQTWIPFTSQSTVYNQSAGTQVKQSISQKQNTILLSSGNSGVSFTVHVDGMTVNEKNIGVASYMGLSIPDCEVTMKEGSPQLPMIVKLIAIPDCDDVILSVTSSNETNLNNYKIVPAPGYISKKQPDGDDSQTEVFAEDKSVYSTDYFYPGMYG